MLHYLDNDIYIYSPNEAVKKNILCVCTFEFYKCHKFSTKRILMRMLSFPKQRYTKEKTLRFPIHNSFRFNKSGYIRYIYGPFTQYTWT